ncbi:Phospholipase D2 [Portunus trituberculatus]|uniref:Phospholipase n=1 Tax=Portunus trituberculatus TaxID=210409 RepID=A0A5B7DQ09_PORTR|nr:Phospholipase D2 [Portunus trituberculatus]
MYRSSVTLASSGYLKEFRRKISKGDAKQEMTPLASHEEVAGTTPDYGGTAETPNSGDAGTDANAASEPVVEKQGCLVIELEHGDHRWSVERKVRQVATLHSKLLLLRTRLRMPAASRITRQRRQSMRQQIKAADQEVEDTVDSSITTNTNTAKTASTVNTNSAASPNNKRLLKLTATCTGKYRQQWLVLKETYLFFVVPETGLVRSVMLMDSAFQVSHSYRLIGARNSLLISNLSRSLLIKCDSETSKKEWLSIITKTERKYAKDFTSQDNRYGSFAPVRKNSYARCHHTSKHHIPCTTTPALTTPSGRYVDGARYMWDVAELMEGAREEIFITDWWMSPQIYLKRPDLTGHKWRLAEVLRRKAESGVRVFILLYKEVELALGISSLLTKQTVNQLHPNIKVLRHPDHIAGGTLYWAHHEKVVVVDQMFAFVSGIDLAFGRWDDYRHKLIDTGHAGVQVMHPPSRPSQHSPGQMGMNRGALQHLLRGTNDVLVSTVTGSAAGSRRASLGTTEDSSAAPGSLKNVSPSPSDSEDPVSTLEVPAGPTVPSEDSQGTLRTLRSVRDSLCLASANPVEPSAGPLASPEDFSADVESQDELDEVQQPSPITNGRKMKGNRSRGKADMNSIHTSTSFQNGSTPHPSQEGKDTNTTSLPPVKRTRFFSKSGRDRANTGSSTEEERKGGGGKSFREVKRRGMDLVEEMKVKGREMKRKLHSFFNIVDRHQTPRMPWHDIGLFVEGAAARDVARHFIQRWNAVKTEKAKPNHSYPYLLPRTYSKESFLSSNLRPRHRVKCQVVRSVGKWSAGVDEVEASIFSAYVDLIRRAKHYIYIENQFFITSSNVDEQKEVSNYIGYEIVQRIVEAHRKGEAFRVYILMPLLPAFEGMIGKASGVAMQYIVYWNYVSICKGKSSVLHCLKEHGITDWERYVSFCSLRNHECLGERPVSELVYIHSKLMIVDDRFVIAGSANINDRSLSGIFAGSMRRYLFSEHLGEADLDHPTMDVSDPVSDAFFTNVWNYVANKNTLIYEEVFSCYPCNSATTFNDLEQLRTTPTLAEVNPADAKAKLKEVQGHLVLFPLEFLKDEMLKPGVGNKEYLLPMETWT